MIKLSSGVELSEDTVVAALKKAGISVEPKHVFEAGDVAYFDGVETDPNWRLIANVGGTLYAINKNGENASGHANQSYFETWNYKYVGRQEDLLKKQQ